MVLYGREVDGELIVELPDGANDNDLENLLGSGILVFRKKTPRRVNC